MNKETCDNCDRLAREAGGLNFEIKSLTEERSTWIERTCEMRLKADALEAKVGRYQEALEIIQDVTKKGHDEFSLLVSGAQKMNEPDMIASATYGSALASLVYKTAEKTIRDEQGGGK